MENGSQREGTTPEPQPSPPDTVVPGFPENGFQPDLGGAFTPLYRRLEELGVASRIVEIGKIGPRGRSADFAVDDPAQFLAALRATQRCCTDTPVGRILHPGKISLREDRKSSSLHIAMDERGRVLAHLDRLSPLGARMQAGTCRYSLLRVVAHNGARLWGDLFRYLFGHRLDCAPLLLSLRRIRTAAEDGRHAPGQRPEPAVEEDPPGEELETQSEIESNPRPAAVLRTGFNVIDEAIHLLDSPVEPWSVHLEIRVAGSLDSGQLRAALGQALARHPLSRARKAGGPSARRFAWEIPEAPDLDPLSVVSCDTEASMPAIRSRFESRAVPLAKSPPLRVLLVHNPAGDVVMLNLNHAATDPTGALRLLRSVARAHAGDPDPEPVVDPLAVRDVRELLRSQDMGVLARRLRVLARKAWDLAAVPARIAPDGGSKQAGYGIHLVRPDNELSQALLSAGDDTRINDLLIAGLHLAIALWNIEHGAHCGRISVLAPVNLRPAGWRQDVVGNFWLLTRVLTTPEQRNLGRVLDAVSSQTERTEREGTAAALIELLARTADLPMWAKRVMPALLAVTGNRLVDSAELAYLGCLSDLPAFGPEAGTTRELWFSPPARMPLGLSIGAVVAASRLHLAFRYRRALFSPEAARRFADYYLWLLEALTGQP